MMEKTYTLTKTVTENDLAAHVGSGSLDVLATPVVASWMEEAALACVEYEAGQTSVGTLLNISHDKASSLGAFIRVEAKLIEHEGRRLRFEVAAYEDSVCVSKGTHERFIVDIERFMKKISK